MIRQGFHGSSRIQIHREYRRSQLEKALVYTSQYTQNQPSPNTRLDSSPESISVSALLDPALLQAARMIYRTFYEVHPDEIRRPIGIAIDRYTHRGKLIFGVKPVLLPQECFVPLNQIDADLF